MKTKKRTMRRKLLSVMLTVALAITMMPPSGGRTAKAADGYPVTYEVKQDSEGNDYISLKAMTSNYASFIVDGILTLPEEIEGRPVKEVGDCLEIQQGIKVVFPASIDRFSRNSWLSTVGGSVREIHIMCQGVFQGTNSDGLIVFFESGSDTELTDIYFYPTDITGGPTDIIGYLGRFNKLKNAVTIHVSSQAVLDKFNANAKVQSDVASGKLILVKDLEVSGDATLAAKRQVLAQKVTQGESVKGGQADYTKGSWAALQAAISEGKKQADSTDEAALDAAIAALDAALAGMVSLKPINDAIAAAQALNEKEYMASSWKRLQDAIAAARAVPDNATEEQVAELAKAVTTAKNTMQQKYIGQLTIAWEGSDSGPVVPPITVKTNNTTKPEYWYYQDEACTTPAVGQDASAKPTQPGVYYIRCTVAEDDNRTAATSNVLKFTITERQVNWNGYQWDAATGQITITEDMPDFPNALEVPWYEDMDKITAVKVKEGVTLTKISAYAFQGAGNLQTFPIPDTVKEIGERALQDCVKLEGTIALTGVTLGENAFDSCGKLQGAVTLADTMTEVPAGCFGWSGISSVTLPEGITAIGKEAFCVSAISGQINLPATVTVIGEKSFSHTGITAIRLPENLETIGEGAFRYCESLGTIELSASLKIIGSDAFENCESLQAIDLPASLQTIGSGAFSRSGLKQIVIPATVQTIGGGQFQGCQNLTYVEIMGKDYGTDTLKSELSGMSDKKCDTMFNQTNPDLTVLCDGTTYDTLASYAGIITESNGSISGWPASILYKTQDYLAKTQAEYQEEKQALLDLQKADYTEATWNSLQQAIAAADALFVQNGSTQETIAGRRAALKKLAEGALLCLQETLDSTKAYLAGENIEKDYDTESDSWWDLQDAMEDVAKTLQDSSASAAQIIKRIQSIQASKNALAPRATDAAKEALDSAIVAITKDLKESDYTPDSWKGLQDALAEAEALKGTGTISQLEAVQKKIEDAAKALIKKNTGTSVKPTTDPDGGTSVKPTTDPNGGTSVKPTTDPDGGTSVKPGGGTGAKTQTPKVKKATIKKVKSTKKKTIQVQWKKQNGVTGYQVQTALSKKFKKGKKTYTIKKAKTTKKTIKKLKRKKKYYVRVRAYKTVRGKKYYGKWSKTKTVKVK